MHFPPRIVTQDFGYSASTHHAGGEPGEVGGTINPAGEPAYYGYRLPAPLTFADPIVASGKILVPRGPGHFLLGLFNAGTLNEWRTPNTLVARINGRGEGFHCHIEYCTSRWRAGAGVIGEIVPGERIEASGDPGGPSVRLAVRLRSQRRGRPRRADVHSRWKGGHLPDRRRTPRRRGHVHPLRPAGDPQDVGQSRPSLDRRRDHRRNARSISPAIRGWEGFDNRRTYETKDTRPRFDFGWSPTQFAGGKARGELGGLDLSGRLPRAAPHGGLRRASGRP